MIIQQYELVHWVNKTYNNTSIMRKALLHPMPLKMKIWTTRITAVIRWTMITNRSHFDLLLIVDRGQGRKMGGRGGAILLHLR